MGWGLGTPADPGEWFLTKNVNKMLKSPPQPNLLVGITLIKCAYTYTGYAPLCRHDCFDSRFMFVKINNFLTTIRKSWEPKNA